MMAWLWGIFHSSFTVASSEWDEKSINAPRADDKIVRMYIQIALNVTRTSRRVHCLAVSYF